MPSGGTAPRTISGVPPYRRRRRASVPLMREPAAVLSGCKKLRQRRIECVRLLRGDGMTGAWNDQQAGGRRGTLEKDAAVETALVLVADDDQQRHRKFLQIRFHVPQCRTLGLQHRHRQTMALRRMFGEHAYELGAAARILIFLGVPD